MTSIETSSLTLELNDYRGLSAYEIAVKNGFEGTETEWLASLRGPKGEDSDEITVNRKKAVDKNITVNAPDIKWQAGSEVTLPKAIEANIETALKDFTVQTVENAETDKTISAAVAKTLHDRTPVITAVRVSLPVSGWEEDGERYKQTAEVAGLTIDSNKTSAIVSPGTAEGVDEAYTSAGVRAFEQGEGTLTFTAVDVPEMDLTANVMVVVKGVGQ